MKQEEANIILHKMSVSLDNVQMLRLQDSLDEIISESESLLPLKSSEELLESFLSTKRLEGRSEKTLGLYRFTITNGLIDKIGVSEITEADQNESNRKIEEKAEEYIRIIEKNLSNKMAELDEEIEDDLSSEIGMYVFQDINTDEYKANSVYARDYTDFVEKYGSASKMLRAGGERVAGMALAKGATDFSKLASSSGSAIHKTVLTVGHFFGAKFKPWQAVKIANGVGKVAKAAGPVLAVVDVALTVATKVADEKNRKEVQQARESAFNSISSVASDIITEIDKQYALMEAEAFDQKLDEINSIKEKMVKEAGENSELVNLLRKYGEELKALMENIKGVDSIA